VDKIKIITTLKWVYDLLQFNGITAPLEDLDDIIMMLKKESLADLIREKNGGIYKVEFQNVEKNT